MLERLRVLTGGLSGLRRVVEVAGRRQKQAGLSGLRRRQACAPPISDATLSEMAYQVGRGVKPLAVLGSCESLDAGAVQHRLEQLADPNAIPFVIDRGDGLMDYGYASAAWVLDLYRWVARATAVALPQQHRDQIVGMMLGYSTSAIQWFVERTRRDVDATRRRVEHTRREVEETTQRVRKTVRKIRRARAAALKPPLVKRRVPKLPSGPRGRRGRTARKSPCSRRGKAGKRSRNAR